MKLILTQKKAVIKSMQTIKKEGTIFVVCGPSGVGKTTIVLAALTQLAPKYHINRVITYTTRPPRSGEINGQDYHFITVENFKALETQGFFFETETFNNNLYGSPISFINDAKNGISSIIIPNHKGAQNIAQQVHTKTVFIAILPPNLTTLRARLQNRKTDSEVVIEQRLAIGKKEIEELSNDALFTIHIINNTIELAVAELINLIKTN